MDWDKLKIFHAVAEAGSFTNATVNLNFVEAGVGSEYITITNSTTSDQIFQKASTNTNNGLTSLQLVIGDTYEIESTFESTAPGSNKTLEHSGSGGGITPFSNQVTGAAQTLLGPITSQFSPSLSTGTVTILVSQT